MIDYRIRTFLSVCETLSFTRTAEQLSISQPAVSQHIAQLERELGAKLFDRCGRRLALSAAGRQARAVAEAMAHDERLLKEAILAQADEAPSIAIGVTLTVGEYLVAAPLARHLVAHPTTQIRIVESNTQHLLSLLRSGDIDCAFVEGFFDKGSLAWRTLRSEPLVGVCAPGYRLAAAPGDAPPLAQATHPVAIDDLLGERLFTREPGSGTRVVLEHALFDRNLAIGDFSHASEVSSIGVIKRLVAGGAGIAFLYEAAVRDDLASGALARIPIEGGPIARHDISFVRLPRSAYAAQLDALFDEIAETRR